MQLGEVGKAQSPNLSILCDIAKMLREDTRTEVLVPDSLRADLNKLSRILRPEASDIIQLIADLEELELTASGSSARTGGTTSAIDKWLTEDNVGSRCLQHAEAVAKAREGEMKIKEVVQGLSSAISKQKANGVFVPTQQDDEDSVSVDEDGLSCESFQSLLRKIAEAKGIVGKAKLEKKLKSEALRQVEDLSLELWTFVWADFQKMYALLGSSTVLSSLEAIQNSGMVSSDVLDKPPQMIDLSGLRESLQAKAAVESEKLAEAAPDLKIKQKMVPTSVRTVCAAPELEKRASDQLSFRAKR